MSGSIRPTKKQQELLEFIKNFIGEHGYSPSYREIMDGLKYNSVATVSLHVNNLIRRGHLRKRDRSARSLEVVDAKDIDSPTAEVKPAEEKWLVDRVDAFFTKLEKAQSFSQPDLDELYVLVGALKTLGFDEAARSFIARLTTLKSKI